MAPAVVSNVVSELPTPTKLIPKTFSSHDATKPLKSTGAKNTLAAPLKISPDSQLLAYKHFDATVPIGTEFPRGSVELVDILRAPNSNDLLRDLATLISERGVVFFRAQHITADEQRELVQRLGELSGKPETSKLHIHPYTPEDSERGDEVFPITSGEREEVRNSVRVVNQLPLRKTFDPVRRASSEWHTDISYEPTPSDYSTLKIHTNTAGVGGDTVWASGYEAYDRLSPRFRQLLEGLYALHDGYYLNEHNALSGHGLRDYRGAPENVGQDVSPLHPIIRTNPVTGWKSVYFNSLFVTRILGVTKDESDSLIQYLHRLITDNVDLQVRFRWNSYEDDAEAHDVALWDNRSSLHTAIDDFFEIGSERHGDRAVGLGERPYYDPDSKSRREDLGHFKHRLQPEHEELLRELAAR